MSHWLKLGISGFRLANTQYLTVDPDLHDEFRSTIPTEADNYDSLVHAYTRDRPENGVVLAKWHERIHNETRKKGLIIFNNYSSSMYIVVFSLPFEQSSITKCLSRFFALQDDIGTDILQVYNENKRLIDLPQNSQFLTTADSNIDATTLQRGFSHWLNFTSWPAWDVSLYKMYILKYILYYHITF